MAYEGMTLRAAADRFDIRQSNLRRSFENPKVKVTYHELLDHIRQNVGQEAYMRIVELSQSAKSETVRADCNKRLAGVDNIAPVKRVEAKYQHNIKFGGFEYPELEPIDVTPKDGEDAS